MPSVRVSTIVGSSALALLVACAEPTTPAMPELMWANAASCDSNAPAVDLPGPQHDSLSTSPVHTIDQSYYDMAQRVPGGFAGLYMTHVNGRRTPVLMFVDTTNVDVALDTLAVYHLAGIQSFARDSVSLRLVHWNWVQLYEWYRYIFVHSTVLPDDWVMSDIDEVQNHLTFGAASYAGRDTLVARLIALGVPCWLATVDRVPPAVLK